MFQVIIQTPDETLSRQYCDKILLADALADAGFPIDQPCGGNGTCGKCKVRAAGVLSALTAAEQGRLSAEEQANGTRLACQAYAIGDTTIYYTTKKGAVQGVTGGVMPEFSREPLSGDKPGHGIAIDIGTTTIAAYLYKLPECECVKTLCEQNRQTQFGADVISRIQYVQEHGGTALTDTVRTQLADMTRTLTDVPPELAVVTGNTTMLHFLTGLDARGIAVSPFTPQSLFGEWRGPAYLPRCMSAYVGADITTAVLASDMTRNTTSFLVDVGTNGEMALWHDGRLYCCSTAAGPAFEGAGISCGMLASEGAVNHVYIEDGKVQYDTIGGVPARGICGTGLIDAVGCMLELGVLDETGYVEEPFCICEGVSLTAQDIRAVQLAKAAISAGVDTLLHECGVTCAQLDAFYIAGGFGAYIDKHSAAKIGLIPHEAVDKVSAIGNAAGAGASMILQSRSMLERSEQLARDAHVVELSASPFFMERYIDNMMF